MNNNQEQEYEEYEEQYEQAEEQPEQQTNFNQNRNALNSSLQSKSTTTTTNQTQTKQQANTTTANPPTDTLNESDYDLTTPCWFYIDSNGFKQGLENFFFFCFKLELKYLCLMKFLILLLFNFFAHIENYFSSHYFIIFFLKLSIYYFFLLLLCRSIFIQRNVFVVEFKFLF